MLLHLWELDDVAIPYYFFRQNCSYQLIRLLAVARPGLDFRHGFPLRRDPRRHGARRARSEIGLAGRGPLPALARDAARRAALDALAPDARRLALGLARGELEPDDERVASRSPERARRAARRRLRGAEVRLPPGRAGRGRVARPLVPAARRAEPRGSRRSVPQRAAPRRAARRGARHGARRPRRRRRGRRRASSSCACGRASTGCSIPEAGFPGDSTIRVLDTRLRFFPDTGRVRLEELVLVRAPVEDAARRLLPPALLGPRDGSSHAPLPGRGRRPRSRRLVWRTGASLGLSYAPGSGPLTVYALADTRLEVGSGFDHGWALGPGAELGLELGAPGDRWQGRLFGRATALRRRRPRDAISRPASASG